MLPEGFILRMQSLLGEEYAAFSASFDRPQFTGLRLFLHGEAYLVEGIAHSGSVKG